MAYSPDYFLGLDPTAGRNPYTWALLDTNCDLLALEGGELEQALTVILGLVSAIVAINSPAHPNLGLVRNLTAAAQPVQHPRGVDLRLAEYLLRERGIVVPQTPARVENCPSWTQLGFILCAELDKTGCASFPSADVPLQRFETNPNAVFCALLGQHPLPKPTLEGRLQRQLVLHGRGAGITDPMDFYEEITRHKLLCGRLPVDLVYSPEELDALAAAFTAWQVITMPEDVIFVGDSREGQIILPVKELKEKYS